jgi:flagellar basal-body rod protein FlgF
MDRLIYVAMTGAKHLFLRQDKIAHNLANADTPGFKAEKLAFTSVATDSSARVYAVESTPAADLGAGPVQQTGRALDVAPEGETWLAVRSRDGDEAYTRNGRLQIDADGTLRTAGGAEILGDAGPIVAPPDSEITIARDGTVSAVPAGNKRAAVTALGRLKLVTPPEGAMVRGEDGLFRARDGAPLPADERASVAPGAIEGSNVNPVEAMVEMISAARQFEAQMKILQTAEANERSASQLLNAGGG